MKFAFVFVLVFFTANLSDLRVARAAKPGHIEGPSVVELRDGPGPGFRSVGKLSPGAAVAASNVPVQGYYKVRASDGRIGFVSETSLSFESAAETGEDLDAEVQATKSPSRSEPRVPGRHYSIISLRALAGGAFFRPQALSELLNTTDLNTGVYLGGELVFSISRRLNFVARVEQLRKSASLAEVSSGDAFQFELRSQPMMVGLELRFDPSRQYFWSISAMGGLALSTSLTSTPLGLDSPTVLTDHAFTGLGKVTLGYLLFGGRVSIFAEGGYRVLRTKEIIPTVVGEKADIFRKNAAFVPVVLDLGGPIAGAGIAIGF